jgi:penicillin-binding protein 1A
MYPRPGNNWLAKLKRVLLDIDARIDFAVFLLGKWARDIYERFTTAQTSDDDWLKKSDLAVTFLDRYGNEIGSRGIKHNDSVPLEEFPTI